MNTVNILGISFPIRSLRESMSHSDYLLHNGSLSSILYITSRMLLNASRDEQYKALLESMDMHVINELDILRVVGISSRNRINEVEHNSFLLEFLKKMEHNKQSVFLLSYNSDELDKLQQYLNDFSYDINIAAAHTMEDFNRQDENLANTINDIAPAVIISNLGSPFSEQLFTRIKPFINAEIWVMLPDKLKNPRSSSLFLRRTFKNLTKNRLHRQVHKYQKIKAE